MNQNRSTILSVGTHLPAKIRTNDWWPRNIVERWENARTKKLNDPRPLPSDAPPAAHLIMKELAALGSDPFVGAKERRVIADGQLASDMEFAAASEALERASLKPEDIDLLLVSSLVPDRVGIPNSFAVHGRLGLSEQCLTIQADSACNSFLQQVEVADGLITRGAVRNALLVQSGCLSKVSRMEDPSSAWFGDAASAVVMSRAQTDAGIVSCAHKTDSLMYRSFYISPDQSQWFEDGRAWVQLDDSEAVRRILHNSIDWLKSVSVRALEKAGLTPNDIEFYGAQAINPFNTRLSKSYIGLDRAQTIDTFPIAGNVGAVSIPLVLAAGEREGLLRPGHQVLMAGGGGGGSWSSVVMRWGK